MEYGQGIDSESYSLRSFDRARVNVSVAYSIEPLQLSDQEMMSFRSGSLLDISDRGICFKARDFFLVGRMLVLELKLSDATDAIRMLGKIIWTSSEADGSTRVGVEFIGTLPSDWRGLLPDKT